MGRRHAGEIAMIRRGWGAEVTGTNLGAMRFCGGSSSRRENMAKVVYRIVEHDGGWAYKVGDVFSEAFPSHEAALAAAKSAAAEQQLAGTAEIIEYEDAKGKWHREVEPGTDRPETLVEDEDEED
jgi:hypothetical protein